MDSQKTTSKTKLLNVMLLRAWRERWTDAQWGINIKTVLPRGVSGDVYNLADCILQQAVIGSDANRLVLSYLRHSLCAHLISYASVLKRISKFDGFDRIHCMIALLDFLESIITGVTCRGKPEEIALVNALLSLVHWLVQSYAFVIKHQENLLPDQEIVAERTNAVLSKIVNNQFLMGILFIGCHEDQELFGNITKLYTEAKLISANLAFKTCSHSFDDFMKRIVFMEIGNFSLSASKGKPSVESITYCLQPMLAVKVTFNPCMTTQQYQSYLLMVQRLKNYSTSRLYYEVLRGCFITSYNVTGPSKESMWCAFTFIKVPLILKFLNLKLGGYEAEKSDYSQDVVAALENLIEEPILDMLDTRCGCNTIEYLLNELVKHNLVNDTIKKNFVSRRDTIINGLIKMDLNNQQHAMIKFVKRAEPAFKGILQALVADYNKMQESLFGVLCQVFSGNSFELILSVATVEGKLKTFVSRLINCNENSKQVSGDVGKSSSVGSSLFDVSFLMLTFIVQAYGSDAVLDENGNSFFEKWVRECMIERNKNKSPMNMVQMCDQSKVDEMLVHLNSSENAVRTSVTTKWQDICLNLPGILYQVLMAWENETISATEVKVILDSIKQKHCAYSVCAASWLCSYMQTVRDDELLKPMNMVQQFLSPLTQEEGTQQNNYKERLGLTFQIIRKMQQCVHPAPSNQKVRSLLQSQYLVSQQPLEEQFVDVWKTIQDSGWLPIESAQTMYNLLQSCGPYWLVSKMVQEVVQCKFSKDMGKMADIVFGIMNMDIENCTVALLTELLPMLLFNKLRKSDIIEPQSEVIAKLCVYCILASIDSPPNSLSKKRSVENEDSDLISSTKLRKMGMDPTSGDSCSNEFISTIQPIQEDKSTYLLRDPLLSAIQNLFKTFAQFAVGDELSPRIQFIFTFLQMLVQTDSDRIRPVLKLLPSGFVQNLLKTMTVDENSIGFILRIYDLTTASGRLSAMSDFSLLRNIELKKDSINL